jgi:hypothetical protein
MKLLLKYLPITLLVVVMGCKKNEDPTPMPTSESAVAWGQMTLKTMTRLTANTPTYGSRALGYMGLTMYECVVNGSDTHRSLAGQLNDLANLPKPESGKAYNWVLAMNAGQALMLKKIYDYTDKFRQYSIDSLEYEIQTTQSIGQNQEVINRSIAYGKAVATAIFEWSKTDGGYQAYLRNFDATYIFPTADGNWIPPTKSQVVSKFPLHPYWGRNRTFTLTNAVLPVPKMITYSTDKQSAYYQQFDEVFQRSKNLTQEDKNIAAWWADDPTETFSPPGHSYNLANIVIKTAQPDLFKAAETYARVGMAVADGFVNCWKTKYSYHCERPSTYVKNNIDPTWVQFWPEPPFPAFYSGHSVQSAASATVLEDLYGKTFKITDNSHVNRPLSEGFGGIYQLRTFDSFWATAEEAALSRFLGGIHTRQDNEIGLAEGRKIGTNINHLNWKK